VQDSNLLTSTCLLACLLDDDGEISVLKLVATSNIASQESNCKFHQPIQNGQPF